MKWKNNNGKKGETFSWAYNGKLNTEIQRRAFFEKFIKKMMQHICKQGLLNPELDSETLEIQLIQQTEKLFEEYSSANYYIVESIYVLIGHSKEENQRIANKLEKWINHILGFTNSPLNIESSDFSFSSARYNFFGFWVDNLINFNKNEPPSKYNIKMHKEYISRARLFSFDILLLDRNSVSCCHALRDVAKIIDIKFGTNFLENGGLVWYE